MSKHELTPECPVTRVAKLLSDTWTILILHALIEGPKRFCALEAALPHISSRTLTSKLKKLTVDHLIEKTADGYYVATKKGAGIRLIEKAMVRYNEEYLSQ